MPQTGGLYCPIKQMLNKFFKAKPPSNEPPALVRTRQGFTVDYIVQITALNVCSGIYLAGLLKFMGISTSMNGTVLALPVLGGLFQIVGPIILSNIKNDKPFLIMGSFLGKLFLALVFFVPIIFGSNMLGAIFAIAIFATGHVILAAITPAVNNWLMTVIPINKRSGFFTFRERVGLGSMAIAMLIGSAMLDIFASPQQQPLGFAIIGIILTLYSIADLVALQKMHKPDMPAGSKITPKLLARMFTSKDVFKVLALTVLWHFSTQVWIPHNNIYILEVLGVSYSLMGVMSTVTSVEKILLMVLWTRYTSRTSFEHSFFTSMCIYMISCLMYMVITPANADVMVIIQQLVGSAAWAILGPALFNVQYDNLLGSDKVLKMGVIGGISGILGFLLSMLGSQVIAQVNKAGSLFGFNGQQVAIMIGSLASFSLMVFLYYGFIPKDKRPKISDYTSAVGRLISSISTMLKNRAFKKKYRSERWIH